MESTIKERTYALDQAWQRGMYISEYAHILEQRILAVRQICDAVEPLRAELTQLGILPCGEYTVLQIARHLKSLTDEQNEFIGKSMYSFCVGLDNDIPTGLGPDGVDHAVELFEEMNLS